MKTSSQDYAKFFTTIQESEEETKRRKVKENEEYIEYIKVHDKEAYQRYLSYATYLECV